MKLTKKQRDEVVTLLLCAGGEASTGNGRALSQAAKALFGDDWFAHGQPGSTGPLVDVACDALMFVSCELDESARWSHALEAAALVEEGVLP